MTNSLTLYDPQKPNDQRLNLRGRLLALAFTKMDYGHLYVHFPNGAIRSFGPSDGEPARLSISSNRAISRLLTNGALGLSEGYMAGEWETDNLPYLLQILGRNMLRLEALIPRFFKMDWLDLLIHAFRKNSRAGSRKNIAYHYDLGNSFYELWLDPSLTYSSAVFTSHDQSLEEAQLEKYRRLCRKVGIKKGDRVLEIGCGWGGFAEVAISEFGAHVTGLTLSREQLVYAQRRLSEAGLGEQCDLRLQDYRDCEDKFDHIISIEMFEAVGEAYWPIYFESLKRCLKPGGRVGIQTITIDHDTFDHYRAHVDFIQKYVFPGGMLPSETVFKRLANNIDFTISDQERFGDSYARTLAIWRKNFFEHIETVREQGFDQKFEKMWDYYLSYCEAGFRLGTINVSQIILSEKA